MKNLIQQCLFITSVLTLVGCGGGGSGGGGGSTPVATNSSVAVTASSPVAVASSSSVASSSLATRPAGEMTQTYSVTVDFPSSFLLQAADSASSTLDETHFAVAMVDLAGQVVARIPLYAGEVVLNLDGSWSVSFSANPRLDYLIVVDINKPIELKVGDSIRQSDLVYAPVTDTFVDIDLGSTAAYSHLLQELGGTGSFASHNFEPTLSANIAFVEQTLNAIQQLVGAQSLSQYSSVTAALAGLQPQVESVVEQELLNTQHLASGTAASLIRDEGGMYTYIAFDNGTGLDINYEALVGSADLASYHYNGTAFEVAAPLALEQDLVLSSSGWVIPGNGTRATAFNDDGSVLTEWLSAPGVKIKLEADQVVDLGGRNIRDFLHTDIDTQGLATLVNSGSVFASGAKSYRIKSSFTDTVYTLPLDTASTTGGICTTDNHNKGTAAADLGGNCNAVELWGANQTYAGTVSELTQIFSLDLGPDAEGFKAVSYWQSVIVQLLDDSAKTARFYQQTDITVDADVAQTVLIGIGTWTAITLPHLSADAAAIQVQMTAPVDESYLLPDLQLLLVKQAGLIRQVQAFGAVTSVENSFNGAANTSILNALSGSNAVSASPTSAAIRAGLKRAY